MASRETKMMRELETLGFEFDRTNSKGLTFYIHPSTGCEVKLPSGAVSDQTARSILAQARRQLGVPTKDNKRNTAQIKEHQAAEREKAVRELAAARAELDRIRATKSTVDIQAAEEVFLRAEKQFKFWDRLMRQASS